MANSDNPKYRYNPEPRISANQLAEYVLASPTRRQSIIRNAKFSPTFLVIRYSAAKDAICNYLADDARPSDLLPTAETEQMQQSEAGGTSFQQNDAALSAEAIKAFRQMDFNQKEPHATFTVNTQQLPKLPINGVEVSIRPDLIARNNGNGTVGAAVLQTSKAVSSKSWRDDHSKIVASLVWKLADEHLASLGKVDRKLCLSIDVFGKSVTRAPTNFKRKLNDIEAACSEICALWPSITPPSDYDGEL